MKRTSHLYHVGNAASSFSLTPQAPANPGAKFVSAHEVLDRFPKGYNAPCRDREFVTIDGPGIKPVTVALAA